MTGEAERAGAGALRRSGGAPAEGETGGKQEGAAGSGADRAFLERLLRTPAPTGSEHEAQRLIVERYAGIADRVETDVHGNVYLGLNVGAERSVMLAAHCDQIGFMVRHVDDNGYLYMDALGGVDEAVLLGERVRILGTGGSERGDADRSEPRAVIGVFGKRPTHLQESDDRKKVPPLKQMWVDIGARNRAEAEEAVRVGDSATFLPEVNALMHGRIAAPGLDDKAGLCAVLGALELCAGAGGLGVALWVVSTVQEEIGCRGAETAAFRLRPSVGVAVDVTFATDDPSNTEKTTIACKFGGGPAVSRGPNTNPRVQRLLTRAGDEGNIPWQPLPSAELEGNDSKPIQVSGGGVAAASVSIPLRNMHTQAEVVQWSDVADTARLLAAFVRALRAGDDLRPVRTGG